MLTPDFDIYCEDLTCSGGDGPSRVKVKGEDFRYWSRVGGSAYRFASPISDDQQLRAHIKQAFRLATKEPGFDQGWRPDTVMDAKGVVQQSEVFLGGVLVTRRLTNKGPAVRAEPSADQAAAIASVRPIAQGLPSQVWLAMESLDSYSFGDNVQIDVRRDLMIGDHTGLVRCPSGWLKVELVEAEEAPDFMNGRRPLQAQAAVSDPFRPLQAQAAVSDPLPKVTDVEKEASADARALFVDTDEQGVRYKEWRSVVSESQHFSYEDWPHEGPAAVHHLLRHVGKFGGDPKQWLDLWCRQKSISEQDRVKHELRCLMEVLYLGGTFDQLNMPVLASFETVARRVQSIVDAYSLGGNVAPDWGNAKLFSGYAAPEDLVSPQLKTWAARRGKEEVELFNARNKMKELRRGGVVSDEAAAASADGNVTFRPDQLPSPERLAEEARASSLRPRLNPSCFGPSGYDCGPGRDGNAASVCDLFPLPVPDSLNMVGGLSRRASQRMARKVRIRHELRELVFALNWMHNGSFDFRPAEGCSPMQVEVLSRLSSLVTEAGDLDDCSRQLSQEAAFRELLRGQDGYTEPATPTSLAPFKLDLISLPHDLSDAPHALNLLGVEDRRYLEVQERMLPGGQDDGNSRGFKPYWDPALRRNPRNYRKFIKRLCDIKYLEFALEPSNHAGVFFVWKSDKKEDQNDSWCETSQFGFCWSSGGVSFYCGDLCQDRSGGGRAIWFWFWSFCRALGCEGLFSPNQAAEMVGETFLFYAHRGQTCGSHGARPGREGPTIRRPCLSYAWFFVHGVHMVSLFCSAHQWKHHVSGAFTGWLRAHPRQRWASSLQRSRS